MIQIEGLSGPYDNSYVLVVIHINEENIENQNPYTTYCFNGESEIKNFYEEHKNRKMICSLEDLKTAKVLVEKGKSPIEVLLPLFSSKQTNQ